MSGQKSTPERGARSRFSSSFRRKIPLACLCLLIAGAAFLPTIIGAAGNNATVPAVAPEIKVKVLPSTLSIIPGQRSAVRIDLERNGFKKPVEMLAEDLPEGMTVEFEENPIKGDSTTAWIYSPMHTIDRDSLISFRNKITNEKITVRLFVNCNIDWVEQFGSVQPDAVHFDHDRGNDVAVDSNKNIYVVGNTKGTVDPSNPNPNSNFDVWLAKYDNIGSRQWIRQLGGNGEDVVAEVAVDGAGNIFIGGSTNDVLPGDGNSHAGNTDYWIAKYNTAGNRQWLKQGGTTGQDGKFGLKIIPDGAGGARLITIVNERMSGTIRQYSGTGTESQVGSFSIAQILRNTPFDLDVGPNGEIFLVGRYTDSGAGKTVEYIVKYNSSGSELWRQLAPAQPVNRQATRVAVDAAGDAYVSGQNDPAGGNSDAWINKYDGGTGNVIWSKTEASPRDDLIKTIGISSSGDVLIAGKTTGVLGEVNGDNPGREDAWVSRRSGTTGDLVHVIQFPVRDIDSFEAIAFDGSNGLILAGYTVIWKGNIGFQDALLMRYVDNPSRFGFLPYITAIMPSSGMVGDSVTIKGGIFGGVTAVRFNGVPASFSVSPLSSEIMTTVPPGATSGRITVTQNCHTNASQTQFTVTP
ncbi:MAG: SBBP repeat-containing protein [Pyrinomonadaceae bacterium]